MKVTLREGFAPSINEYQEYFPKESEGQIVAFINFWNNIIFKRKGFAYFDGEFLTLVHYRECPRRMAKVADIVYGKTKSYDKIIKKRSVVDGATELLVSVKAGDKKMPDHGLKKEYTVYNTYTKGE